MLNWYAESIEETVKRNATDIENGLSPHKAARRLERYGKNSTRELEIKKFSELFFGQIKDFTFILLFSAAVVSFVIAVNRDNGNWLEPIIILLICAAHAVIGAFRDKWVQEERIRLRSTTVPEVTVVRGGVRQQIPVEELVPGDIFFFCEGDLIPADGRLIQSDALICDERTFSGAARAEKDPSALLDVTTPLAERVNMVYFASTVLSGSGSAIVVATGMNTVAGMNSGMLSGNTAQKETPFMKSTNELQKPVVVTTLLVCALIFIIGFSWRYTMQVDAIETLLTAFALAVTVIPEMLSGLFVLSKTAGAHRLAKKHAIVRNLQVMETLSNVTVICADKTGILTAGTMEPVKLWTAADGKIHTDILAALNNDGIKLLEYAAICNSGTAENTDATDNAVVPVLNNYQIKKTHLELRYPRQRVVPFDRSEKMMITMHSISGGSLIIAKGAPESILQMCDDVDTEKVNAIISQLGSESLRLIAVASRELSSPPEDVPDSAMHTHLSLVGFIGMNDPLRDYTLEAAAVCQRAGIRLVMTTGDHPATAAAVARECGILREGDELLTGDQLANLTDAELNTNIRKYSVYARITPSDKLRIVNAWQNYNEVVAVTGFTVDDVSALTAAEVGLAPSSAVTAARMSADAVMPEGSLAAVAGAVREGRTICSNIRNAAKYMLQCDIAAALLMIPGIIICGTFPILSVHLLIASLIVTGMCAIAVCTEPSYGESMTTPPHSREASVFSSSNLALAFTDGLIAAALSAGAFFIGNAANHTTGRTMAFGVLVLSNIICALMTRMPVNGYRPGIRHNKSMMYAGGAGFVILLLSVLLFRPAVMLTMLTPLQWLIMLALGITPAFINLLFRLIREMIPISSYRS